MSTTAWLIIALGVWLAVSIMTALYIAAIIREPFVTVRPWDEKRLYKEESE